MAHLWWHGEGISRFASSLIAAEWPRLRPGAPLPALPWSPTLPLGETGLGLDSLNLMSMATALTEALHLQESGIEDYLLARRHFGEWCEIAAAGLDRFSSRITFRSSGSTGQAKSITHEVSLLQQEIGIFAALFADRRRIVTPLPAHHIYGFLFTLLLPATLGVPVVDLRSRSLLSLSAAIQPDDLIVAHPHYWAELARSGIRLPRGVIGTSSTAPLPPALAAALQEAGLDRLVEIYGSSETAGIGWRDDPEQAFQLLPYWHFDGKTESLVRTPEASNEAGAQYALVDQLEWADDVHFHVKGRRDGAVQIGGHNVYPDHIREILLQLPMVAAASVRLMNPSEGDRLKAFIVPVDADSSPDKLRQMLHAHIVRTLRPAERPVAFTFGKVLPKNTIGKDADWTLY